MRTEGIRFVCLGVVYFSMQVKMDISPVLVEQTFKTYTRNQNIWYDFEMEAISLTLNISANS